MPILVRWNEIQKENLIHILKDMGKDGEEDNGDDIRFVRTVNKFIAM